MKILRSLVAIAALLAGSESYGQVYSISGRVIDAADTTSLTGAAVTIAPAGDTTQKKGNITDEEGRFTLADVAPGQYILRINFISYKPLERTINVIDADVSTGTLKLESTATNLKGVTVQGRQTRSTQSGDTTNFNSSAYKTNPDANAEDLITKMPGITSDNNGVKVNGETVKEVLVDGKPFFGDDPNAALKNLPAEIIDKIQVFDKMSDQSQFTGFDDGNTSKSINIITKRGRNAGQFGKVYAGYGYGQDPGMDNRYQVGGNVNFFNGDRRISLIGMSNNINQQNFSIDDITGSVGSTSGQNRGGVFRGGRSGGGRGGWQGGAGDFLVGQQGGISTTNSIGINYSDNWGKKLKVSGSYFFNSSRNSNNSDINRTYFTNNTDSSLLYQENSTISSANNNHRANLRLEYTIDSSNSIILSPRLSIQDFSSTSQVLGANSLTQATDNGGNGNLLSRITNRTTSNSLGINFSNNILYRHKFRKDRRTLSLSVNTSVNNRTGDGNTYSLNEYVTDTTLFDLQNTNTNNSYTLSGNLSYTEPLGKASQLSLSYNPSYTSSVADKNTDSLGNSGFYDVHAPLLSNKFDNTYTTHRGEVSYRIGDRKINFNIGLSGQYAILEGTQYEPYAYGLNKTFVNLLPNAMFNYRFTESSNLRLFYRSSTNPPSISQLQDVVDISNPLLLRTGNPDLKQNVSHNLSVRLGNTNSKTQNNFFVFANGNYIANYIGSETIIPTQDTTYNGIAVNRGSQISRPVNLEGYFSGRTFVTYGMPVDFIKSNLNLNAGFTFTHAPSLLNRQTNFSDNYGINGGLVLGSNISENLDFTVSYTASYNTVKNTLQTQSDNSYFNHLASAKVNWIFFDGFVLNTSLNHNLYSGLSGAAFNQQFLQWNAYLGYKFLKNRALEARISAFDILNQNKSIARNITETYVEDTRTQVLTQYFMFTLTYTLRNFKSGTNVEQPGNGNRDRFRPDGPPPGGFRPDGPPGGMN
ncbi:MAG: TonB-dependent receptor [Flavipsychrobacter sp.]|nr:TonB-dependent receptor [Flavipsychrobacter sp.]